MGVRGALWKRVLRPHDYKKVLTKYESLVAGGLGLTWLISSSDFMSYLV